ncbi:MAG TPA: hypothetical protein VFL17_14730 [Anaerolineae bacterium]|nr:hypothetical protein [Anaerolineae bacterium]
MTARVTPNHHRPAAPQHWQVGKYHSAAMQSQHKRISIWRNQKHTLIRVLLLGCIIVASCSPQSEPTPYSELAAETDDRDILESNTETKIPRSATDIHGYVDGFRDVTTYARFTIPAEDFGEFLQSTACTSPLETADIRERVQGSFNFNWWRPEDAQSFQWCDASKEHLVQRVFADTTNPDTVIVYIVATTR